MFRRMFILFFVLCVLGVMCIALPGCAAKNVNSDQLEPVAVTIFVYQLDTDGNRTPVKGAKVWAESRGSDTVVATPIMDETGEETGGYKMPIVDSGGQYTFEAVSGTKHAKTENVPLKSRIELVFPYQGRMVFDVDDEIDLENGPGVNSDPTIDEP